MLVCSGISSITWRMPRNRSQSSVAPADASPMYSRAHGIGAVSATTWSSRRRAGSLATVRRKLPIRFESSPAAGPKNTFWNSSAPARAMVVSAKSRSASAMSMPVWNT